MRLISRAVCPRERSILFIFNSFTNYVKNANNFLPYSRCGVSAINRLYHHGKPANVSGAASGVSILQRFPKSLLHLPNKQTHQTATLFGGASARDTPIKEHPTKGTLVYYGTMTRLVRFVKLFSLSSSAVGISIQPAIYDSVSSLHWALQMMVGGFAGFFIFITPLLLNFVTKRYVTQMYFDVTKGTFSATTYTFFLREREHVFTAQQVTVPTTPGIFTTIRVKEKVALFLDPDLFLDRKALIQLLRYDEPLDWEISQPEITEKKSDKL